MLYLLELVIFFINFNSEPLNFWLAKAANETSAGAKANVGGAEKEKRNVKAAAKQMISDFLIAAEITRIFGYLNQS